MKQFFQGFDYLSDAQDLSLCPLGHLVLNRPMKIVVMVHVLCCLHIMCVCCLAYLIVWYIAAVIQFEEHAFQSPFRASAPNVS